MSQKLKAALIGCGGMGTTHSLSLKRLSEKMDVEMIAIADCRKEYLERTAQQWPDVHAYRTGMELLEKETPDFVHICLPSYLHAAHAVAAMKKGCHVFIEKPVCLTKEECETLLAVQKQTGVKVMVGQVIRSFPEYRYLKKAYEEKTLGELKSLVMQRISGRVDWGFENWFSDEKKSGSVVLDLHIHDLDFLRYMLGEPDSFDVRATSYDSGMINQVMAFYEFGTVPVTAEAVWDRSPSLKFEASFRASFEKGTLVYNGTRERPLAVYMEDGAVQYPDPGQERIVDSSAGINISEMGPYGEEIRYFVECLRTGKEIRRAPLEEGVRSVLLALEELRAARAYVDVREKKKG